MRLHLRVFSWLTLLLALLILPLMSEARDIAGIQIPDTVTLSDGTPLVLNGAGVRKKYLFSVYVGALYLPQTSHKAEDIINQAGATRMFMQVLFSKVESAQLVQAWNEGFSANNTPKALAPLRARIAQFNNLFPTVTKGDRVMLDYLPGKGTQVSIKNQIKGIIPGADFHQALLKVWLGEHPPTTDFKDALLANPS